LSGAERARAAAVGDRARRKVAVGVVGVHPVGETIAIAESRRAVLLGTETAVRNAIADEQPILMFTGWLVSTLLGSTKPMSLRQTPSTVSLPIHDGITRGSTAGVSASIQASPTSWLVLSWNPCPIFSSCWVI
jgi:hypothetical protein